jgi:capreomycidine synthase
MQFAEFKLGTWFNKYYFDTEIVLCVSGVEEFSMGEIRELAHLSYEEMDKIVFKDSPSYGAPGIRNAIAQRWRQGDADQVMVTHGSSEAMFLVMNGMLQAGDEVVVLTPCYQPLLAIPEALGCTVKCWQLRPEKQFVPDIAELKQLLSPRTRMVVVNFPNNPTGATLTESQYCELIDAIAEVNAYLLWDAAFTELAYCASPLPDPATSYARTITLGTLTKTYGLGGLRVGWCLAPPDVLVRSVRARDYITLNLSPLIEYIGQKVVENIDVLLDIRLQQARENLALLASWVEQHSDRITWACPQGGVSAFIKFEWIGDVEDFCLRLAHEHGVFLLPGACFGYPEYVRLGFGGPTHELEKGLARISQMLEHHE